MNHMEKVFEQRLEQCRREMAAAQMDGLLVTRSHLIYHLTGWQPPEWARAFLILSGPHADLISPFEPESLPNDQVDCLTYEGFSLDRIVHPEENALEGVTRAVKKSSLEGKTLGMDPMALPAAIGCELQSRLKTVDSAVFLARLIARKDPFAIEAIRKAVQHLDSAFRVAQDVIQAGLIELELFAALQSHLSGALGKPVVLACNLASGSRTLTEEPAATNKALAKGETILIDLFPMLGPYGADYTRNFILGQASDAQRHQHRVLEEALDRVEEKLGPGLTAREIDALVRKTITNSGCGPWQHPHHSGHAFGLSIPEWPWIIAAENQPLETGMVIAIEPGIYHPENGGMRLESNYLITERGFERLESFPRRLIEV
jgi:Xaa-Pro aminopeptidase